MNKKQWLSFILGAALFSVSELFPPWIYQDAIFSGKRSAGFHFVFGADPVVQSEAEMRRLFSLSPEDPFGHFVVKRDDPRLFAQRLILVVLTLGAVILFRPPRGWAGRMLGGLLALCGCVGVCFYYLLFAFR